MSWWNQVSVSNIASEALKKAQKKIDKVLDIQGEGAADGDTRTETTATLSSATSPGSPTVPEDGEFWNTWLPSEKLGSLGAGVKALGRTSTPSDVSSPPSGTMDDFSASASEFFSTTVKSSLSKVKSLQKKAEASSVLKKKSEKMSSSFTASIDVKRSLSEELQGADEKISLEASSRLGSISPRSPRSEQDSADVKTSIGGGDAKESKLTEPLKITVPEITSSSRVESMGSGLLTTATEKTDQENPGAPSPVGSDRDMAQSCDSAAVIEKTAEILAVDTLQSSQTDEGLSPVVTDTVVSEGQGYVSDKTVAEVSEENDQAVGDLREEVEAESSGWGDDVSLSLITESQMSSSSSTTVEIPSAGKDSQTADSGCDKAELTSSVTSNDSIVAVSATGNVASDSNEELKMQASESSTDNAWDIPELSESALVVDESEPPVSDSADKETDISCQPEDSTSQPETADDNQHIPPENTQLSKDNEVPSEGKDDQPTDSTDSATLEVVCDDKNTLLGLTSDVPGSMEDSTETQEELSEGNRTLTAEEICQARMSSESSQATLELGPEDVQERATEVLDSDPASLTGSHTSQASLPTAEDKTQDSVSEVAVVKDSGVTSDTPEKQASTSDSKDNLTSSSYVKNMLEEAMVESVKDTDSHTDSQSSSDMVRIESGPTSGHTSADEIETNTSSDIEIISHISTPTPNGEGRLFDLSPLRHALSRTMRRNSPPGHKRSDSSSSSQSRNGDELVSPDSATRSQEHGVRSNTHRDSRKTGEEVSKALESEKLLKAPNHINPLQPIQEHPESVTMETPDHVSMKLAETAEVLDARERKLVELSRENMDLVESNNILRQQLEQSEEARESEMTDLNTLTEEFTKRMGEAEFKIQSVIREKEQMRKKLQDTEAELVKRANDKATERIMREKDQQIAELLEEGEKLSKQQLQVNNIIRKLRVKEKENDSLIKSQKQKVENQEAEIEKLQKVLDNKLDNEKKQNDAITQLNNAVLVQEAEINRLKSELEDSTERVRSMQVALDNSYKEIADLHKMNVSRASQMQEEALSVEIKARNDLQVALEQYQQQARQEQETLFTQIEDHRLSINRMEKEHGRREDILKQEISDLQQRLQDAEDRNQDLTQSVTQATRPLLRQIENLQSTYAAQVNSYEKVEKNLTERLTESQTSLALAQEKERTAKDALIDIEVKLSTLETQVSKLRQEKSRLQASLEMERAKLEVLEDAKNNESAQLEALRHNFDHEVNELRKEKVLAENQLEMEKMRVEAEKKKVSMLHEQLREKEIQWAQARKANSPTPTAFSRENSFTVDLPIDSPMNLSQHEDVLEKTLLLATSNGSKTSLYESLRQAGATTIVESLQSQLKMRDGEIFQLQSDIQELERTRESMARELVSLSNQNGLLEDQVKEFPEYQAKYKDLDQRYQALLQMYGEKVEEAEELRLDLQDIKDMYKAQINELLKNQ